MWQGPLGSISFRPTSMYCICIYTKIKMIFMRIKFQQKVAFFFVAQPAQRPFSDPKEAVTSRGKRTLL